MIQLPGDITGKTALITGSTSGIGLKIAEVFAKAGVNVAINGFGEREVIEAQLEELRGHGVKAVYAYADLANRKEIDSMIKTVEDEIGSVDILVNNAGIQHVQSVEDFDRAMWDKIIAINLTAVFITTQNTLPKMKEKGWGRIINIGSAHSLRASPNKGPYVAAKHGVYGFTKNVALEAAKHGVTCNILCPGYVKTPLVEGQIADNAKANNQTEEEVVDGMLKKQATGEFVTDEQVAYSVLGLCADHAKNTTGAALPIDGGWTVA